MNYKILKKLCLTPSPSNFETEIIKYISSIKLNNFVFKKSKVKSGSFRSKMLKNRKTILIDAHIDQVHLRVLRVDKSGYVVAKPVGFDSKLLYGNTINHLDTNLVGVISTPPPHLKIKKETIDQKTGVNYIDFGMKYKEASKIFLPGDAIIFNLSYIEMNKNYIISTGLDNKVSAFILIELLKYLDKNINKLKYNLIAYFSSREEIGLGSFIDTNKLNIDNVIVIDTDVASDSPLISSDLIGNVSLNKGTVITRNFDDNSMIENKLKKIAEKEKINYQLNFSSGMGASNNRHYSHQYDSYSQFLGTPLRNMHSPSEVVNKKDIESTFKLLKKFLTK
jgi:tetrahedral aminopeptidase